MNGKLSGKVAIGMTTWRSQIIFPKLLPLVKERFPNINITAFEGNHDYLENLFDTNKVDFCIFHLPNKYDGIVYEKIRSEKILLCVNSNNPIIRSLSYENISGFKEIKSKDFLIFKNSNFIMLKNGQNIRLLIDNYLNSLMITPNEIFETSNITTATELVRKNLGITFVPEDMMHTIGYSENLTFYHIKDSHLNWDLCVARRKDKPLSYISKVVVDTLKEVYGN
ncbi:LysR family transcriptional regulator substrate-binding protein [Peptoniphilaceae bacterium SGI.131]